MTIFEWFDITNIEHLRVFKSICDGKYWPKNIMPKGITFPTLWHTTILDKLANAYLNEKLLKKTNDE